MCSCELDKRAGASCELDKRAGASCELDKRALLAELGGRKESESNSGANSVWLYPRASLDVNYAPTSQELTKS